MVRNALWGPEAWFFPLTFTAAAGRSLASLSEALAGIGPDRKRDAAADLIPWTTPNEIVAQTASMRLRRFGAHGRRRPLLVAAPFTLHDAGMTDLAEGHSLVAALTRGGRPVFLTEWRSATAGLADCSVETYLADLLTAIAFVGGPVDLVGLCQGGWMALVLAALFPSHVRRLAIVGAPVDMHAGGRGLGPMAASTPPELVDEIIRLGGGLVPGARLLDLFVAERGDRHAARAALQIDGLDDAAEDLVLDRFFAWYARTLDLPGAYFRHVFDHLFRQNELAHGEFVAFGRRVDLQKVSIPLLALAGGLDTIAPPEQVFAVRNLVGTPRQHVRTDMVPTAGHFELYMGGQVLRENWPVVLDFLA